MTNAHVTLTITERQKEDARDLAKELGVNPNEFMSAVLVNGIQSMDKSNQHLITHLLYF